MVRYTDIATTAAKAVLMTLRVGPDSYSLDVLNSEFGPAGLAPEFVRNTKFETIASEVVGPGEDATDGVFHVVMKIKSAQLRIEAHVKVSVNAGRMHGLIEPTIFIHDHLDHRGHPYYLRRNASIRNGVITLRGDPEGYDFRSVINAVEAEMREIQPA